MTVLQEILTWAQERPAWQQEALRRMLSTGELTDRDIRQLTEICKGGHGLADVEPVKQLSASDLPSSSAGAGKVTLVSIFHHHGVNALAENQTLNFDPCLTIVYGDNGAGKTGYIRILKSACRARGTEEILGNVVSGSRPLKPDVAIKYCVGNDPKPREWTWAASGEPVARVSVFDSHSAGVYLREKTDVAFRPFGLDLFDRLVKACKAIRTRLETEQRAVGATSILPFQVPENTAVAKLLSGLSSLTDPERVKKLAELSEAEKQRISLLDRKIIDLQANDPKKLAQQLARLADQLRWLYGHIKGVEDALTPAIITAAFSARDEVRHKRELAESLRRTTFPESLLAGTGSDEWQKMWAAAEDFSKTHAYPDKPFPVTEADAHCVLCQQNVSPDAAERFRQFHAFVVSTAERELSEAGRHYVSLEERIDDHMIEYEAVTRLLGDLKVESEEIAFDASAYISTLSGFRRSVIEALQSGSPAPPRPEPVTVGGEIKTTAEQLEERVATLRGESNEDQRQSIVAELQELQAREVLAKNQSRVLDEIERKKKVAAYGQCIEETRTQAITQKSTSVTRAAVTEKLTQGFLEEIDRLEFRHIEVEMQEAGGDLGVLYHKLVLKRAPGVEVPKIVSEGEARCLSIAAFFAELTTADDASGIVFDDPVSSLDYKWRENVARRLVEESKTRQVIVFTHDVVFLLHLHQFAKEQGVDHLDQHVRQWRSQGAGICSAELPWVAMPVRKRIGHLRGLWQDADKLFRNGNHTAYEKDAAYIYGMLREAWERGLEEVLLGGVVERYRPSVQTQQIAAISDITDADTKALENGMTKCSRWLAGHDQAPAARAEMPEPQELKADIDGLDNWINVIRQRRK